LNPLSYFYSIRSYVEAYAGFLGRRFISILWVVAICVVIWFYGSLVGYGDFKPLTSASARLIAIGAVLLLWAAYLVFTIIRARRRDKALVDDLENDAEADASASQRAEVGEIRERLKEALQLLRRVTRKRFGYVYELPWYAIFGAPGSGKTTALTNSGLTFPLGDAMGANSVQGAGGTRHCNWWFTEEAILIDTAGRYTTQDDLNGASKAGWEGFLALLKKHRRSQPINGALITISIEDLLTRDTEEQRLETRALRQRLADLDGFLQARIPVYLVFTKADLLDGFVEFFDGLSRTDREQVLGTTFTLEESKAGQSLPDRFVEEFSLLQKQIGSMMIERLQQEPSQDIRGRIFRFPAEFGSLKDKIHEVVSELCSGSKLIEPPYLRGIYFASGTQSEQVGTMPRARRSYFLTRLFKSVIFEEAALVTRDRRLSQHRMIIRRASIAATAALVAVVLASWTATYFHNLGAIAQAEERINAYERSLRGVPVEDVADADFLRILPALENLKNVTSSFSEGPDWQVGFGLDQESKIESRQRNAYRHALNSLLLPRLLVQLQNDLDEASDPDKIFDALKFYGMLGGLGPVDSDFVSRQAEHMFAALYPGQSRQEVRTSLLGHVDAMVAGPLSTIALDDARIEKARQAIKDYGVARRAFAIMADTRAVRDLAEWTPANALGPLGAEAFSRKSGASMQDGIPGLFTGEAFRSVVLPGLGDAAREAIDEEWVRGNKRSPDGTTVEAVTVAARQIYFDQFEKEWTGVLADLQVRQLETFSTAADTLRALSGKPNPLELMARSIAFETDLLGEAASLTVGDAATNTGLEAVRPPDPYAGLRQAMERSGDEETTGEGQTSSIFANLQKTLQTMHSQLSRASTSSAAVAKIFAIDSNLTQANQDLVEQARVLPAPLGAWMAELASDIDGLAVKSARSEFNALWKADGAKLCSSAVTGRYPFDRSSKRDVAMADFVRLFGPEGLFPTFFADHLQPFVDTTTTPWRWRGSFGTEGPSSDAIAQFENADRIRRAFFPNGAGQPSVAINIEPVDLSESANAVILEIEGERVVYYHGPIKSKSITWPSEETVNLSRIVFQPGGWQAALTENGDWSAFRLFDRAKILDRNEDTFRARFSSGDEVADFDVQFGSVLNPFSLAALSDFSCPADF
jgi:type VI secretion system protein ImpL